VRAVSFTVGIDASSTDVLKKHQRVPPGNTGVTTRPKLVETARVRSNHISAANSKGFLTLLVQNVAEGSSNNDENTDS